MEFVEHFGRVFHCVSNGTRPLARLAACYDGQKSAMKYSLMIASVLTLVLALAPLVTSAQTDQTATTAPMATPTLNPSASANPMASASANPMASATANPMESATAAPMANTYPASSGSGGSSGWWGLVGLLGLLGLFGRGRSRTTTST
jgi:MYXO-CTERM domain-containing protein